MNMLYVVLAVVFSLLALSLLYLNRNKLKDLLYTFLVLGLLGLLGIFLHNFAGFDPTTNTISWIYTASTVVGLIINICLVVRLLLKSDEEENGGWSRKQKIEQNGIVNKKNIWLGSGLGSLLIITSNLISVFYNPGVALVIDFSISAACFLALLIVPFFDGRSRFFILPRTDRENLSWEIFLMIMVGGVFSMILVIVFFNTSINLFP